jgi:hypothetical protein
MADEAQSQKSDGMFDRRYTKPTIVYCNHASERQCTCHEAVMKNLIVLRQLYAELATRTKLLEECMTPVNQFVAFANS